MDPNVWPISLRVVALAELERKSKMAEADSTDLELIAAQSRKAEAVLNANSSCMFTVLKGLVSDYDDKEGILDRDGEEWGYEYKTSEALIAARALIAHIEKEISS